MQSTVYPEKLKGQLQGQIRTVFKTKLKEFDEKSAPGQHGCVDCLEIIQEMPFSNGLVWNRKYGDIAKTIRWLCVFCIKLLFY